MVKYVIDRFEGDYCILEDSECNSFEVLKNIVPHSKEGDVVAFDGVNYITDEAETEKRKKLIENKMNSLFKNR